MESTLLVLLNTNFPATVEYKPAGRFVVVWLEVRPFGDVFPQLPFDVFLTPSEPFRPLSKTLA